MSFSARADAVRHRLARGVAERRAVRVVEGRPAEGQALVERGVVGRERVLAGELHARQRGAGLRRHQEAVAGQAGAAEDALEEGAAAGGEHGGAGLDPPVLAGRARTSPAAPVTVAPSERSSSGRVVVEDVDPGAQHPGAHEAHVVGAAQIGGVELPLSSVGKG